MRTQGSMITLILIALSSQAFAIPHDKFAFFLTLGSGTGAEPAQFYTDLTAAENTVNSWSSKYSTTYLSKLSTLLNTLTASELAMEDQRAEILDDLDSLGAVITGVGEQLSLLSTISTDIGNRIGTATTNIAQDAADITTLTNTFNTEISPLQTQIESNQAAIDALKSSFSSVKDSFNGHVATTQGPIEALKVSVAQDSTTLYDHGDSFRTYQGDYKNAEHNIDVLQAGVAASLQEINDLVDTINEFNPVAEDLKNEAHSLWLYVNDFPSEASVNSRIQKIDELVAALSNIQTVLNLLFENGENDFIDQQPNIDQLEGLVATLQLDHY